MRADFEALCAEKGGKPFYGVYAQIAKKYEISGSQAERICKKQMCLRLTVRGIWR